jgi:hypothetical protein
LAASTEARPFPLLRLAAGVLFILAGLFAYYGINFGVSFALVFIAAGVAVVIIGVLGHRARPGDVALFVIGLVVLAIVASNYNFSTENAYTYSITKGEVSASRIAIVANTNFGSITIKFSTNASLAYRVDFGKFFGFPFTISPGNQSRSLSNVTRDGMLIVNASSSTASITITLGVGYLVDVNATAGTGSVTFDSTSQTQKLGVVTISTGTGSISAEIDTTSISYLHLETGTGSINLQSSYLSPSGPRVPVSITTGTGSVSLNLDVPNNIAVQLSVSNGFGSISKNLQGFTISQSTNGQLQASLGDVNTAPRSFVIDTSVGTGSMSINVVAVTPSP